METRGYTILMYTHAVVVWGGLGVLMSYMPYLLRPLAIVGEGGDVLMFSMP